MTHSVEELNMPSMTAYQLFFAFFLIFSVIWERASKVQSSYCQGPVGICTGPNGTPGFYEKKVDCIDRCNTCEYKGNCSQILICTPGCDCISNYFRLNGVCVPSRICPEVKPLPLPPAAPRCQGPYEIYTDHTNLCQRCEFRNGGCNLPLDGPGCDCVKGYFRDWRNICVPPKQCFPSEPSRCQGPYEVYTKHTDLCQRCEFRNGGCNLPLDGPGCDCIKGYFRDWRNICVPPNQCFPSGASKCQGPYEVYTNHTDLCRRCEFRNGECNLPLDGPGCHCIKGYFRDWRKVCVPPNKCFPRK